jgi:hypothetical protein
VFVCLVWFVFTPIHPIGQMEFSAAREGDADQFRRVLTPHNVNDVDGRAVALTCVLCCDLSGVALAVSRVLLVRTI